MRAASNTKGLLGLATKAAPRLARLGADADVSGTSLSITAPQQHRQTLFYLV